MKEYKELLDSILFKFINKTIEKLYVDTDEPISISMIYYLDTIYLAEGITPSELAAKLKVSRPATSKMIKKLLKLNYISKDTSAVKGNTYTVSLTQDGLKIYNISNKINNEFIELLDKHLGLSNIKGIEEKLENIFKEYS